MTDDATTPRATYRCNHCNRTVRRASTKRWIRSYCEPTGRMTRLWRVVWPVPAPTPTRAPR